MPAPSGVTVMPTIREVDGPIDIISLGAGVQSSTMALMAKHGKITPMPKHAVFADTQAEPDSVYEWLAWLEKQLPFPVHRVTAGSLTDTALRLRVSSTGNKYVKTMLPINVLKPDGKIGQLTRACTIDYKVNPLIKAMRRLGGARQRQKHTSVINWIGISSDEISRMKTSPKVWYIHRYPLIDMGMTRKDCINWMRDNGYPEPPRSACVYCPYHSNAEWSRLKRLQPNDFAKAVEFEKQFQQLHAKAEHSNKINGVPFLHQTCVALDAVDFDKSPQQGSLNFNNECEGMCGV